MIALRRALMLVFEVLCACCVVVSVVAAAAGQVGWALTFAGLAWATFETEGWVYDALR